MAFEQPRSGSRLAARYLGYVLSTLLVILLGVSSFLIWRQLAAETNRLEVDAIHQAEFIAAISPEAVLFRDYLTLETFVGQASNDHLVAYVVILDTEGRSLTRYIDRSDPMMRDAMALAPDRDPQSIVEVFKQSSLVREVRRPIVSGGTTYGEVRLGYSIGPARQGAINFAFQALLLALLWGIAVAGVTAFVFDWQIRRPLTRLLRATIAFANGNLDERVEVERRDEIGVLHEAFNVMAEQLQSTVAEAKSAQASAEQAAQAKSAFLANMSHEIRTPLNAVLGLTDLVLFSDLDDEQREMLGSVQHSGVALLGIINDILCLSKIEADRLDLDVRPMSLRDCVAGLHELFALEADRKGLRLDFGVDDGVARTVVGDEPRLRQILVNLVGNAIKFTESGEIEVRVRSSTDHRRGQNRIDFLVRDTGMGIDQSTIGQLFEPFSQADASTTRRYGGTGLGLTISRRLVELMGGDLQVTSIVGEGSLFSFTIPMEVASEPLLPTIETTAKLTEREPHGERRQVQPAPQPQLEQGAITEASHRPLRILLAEDNAVNQIVAIQMLKRLGHTADLANDGVEAVELATSSDYDLIFMDIQMPELDGIGAMKRIRQTLPEARWPQVVALTANAVEGDRERYLAAGMDGYVAKPVRLPDLEAVIAQTRALIADDDRLPAPQV